MAMLISGTNVFVIEVNRIIEETIYKQDLRIQIDKDALKDYKRPQLCLLLSVYIQPWENY